MTLNSMASHRFWKLNPSYGAVANYIQGDDNIVSGLEARVEEFDVQSWIRQHQRHTARPTHQTALVENTPRLHNPYAGVSYAWQLTETVDNFLARFPPSTTPQSEEVPWIFVCNPYISRVEKILSNSLASKGNEDEAPEEEGNQLLLVTVAAEERLQILMNLRKMLEASRKSKAMIEKEMNKERKQAAKDILHFAHEAKVRAGKWMLFCSPSEVDEVWEIVAKATVNNELGVAAKVAPRPMMADAGKKERLICIYTTDFMDLSDVNRVLRRLRDLNLVESRGRGIYYKPDVFTYIGIGYGNPWGLRASIYNSNEVTK